jgi:predicted acyltransferase
MTERLNDEQTIQVRDYLTLTDVVFYWHLMLVDASVGFAGHSFAKIIQYVKLCLGE